MMMKLLSWLSLFIILAFILSRCAPANPSIQPTQVLQLPTAAILSTTVTNGPTSTLTPVITATKPPVPTVTVRLPTATLSPTITPTLVDILATEKVNKAIQPLLKEPMNCDVPCFLGIIPGTTRLSEARTFFSDLGFTPFEGTDQNSPSSGKHFYTILFDSGTGHNSRVTLYSNNDLVESIVLVPDIPKPKEGRPREWIAYSPETLIKRYGSPSRVRFGVDWQQRITIAMIMYFDQYDLIVWYAGIDMDPKQFCPLTAPFDDVRLWLRGNPPGATSSENVPLEKATSLTMEQFTELMLGDPQKACITLNSDEFP